MENELIRINKYLSGLGICSRREADRLLEEGRIKVDGGVASPGTKVNASCLITIDDKPVERSDNRPVVLAFNKPKGIVCSTVSSKHEGISVIDYIGYPQRIYPVGRLDKDSTGLLLLSNQGELSNEILKARNYHEKEYEVTVNKPITDIFIKKMSEGVEILDTKTRPCKVKKTGEKSFNIVLTQGLNRQIRRMCEALGYRVRILHRVRILNIQLGNLAEGKYRELSAEEISELMQILKRS